MTSKIVDDGKYWIFKCPACGTHYIPKAGGWHFDGQVDSPTITPSLRERTNAIDHPHYQPDIPMTVCHLFVRAGQIEFLGDCTHSFAGKTVEMESFTQDELARWPMSAE